MNVKRNEFVIGIVMITAVLSLIFGVFWLGNSNIFSEGITINALINNAGGVSKDDPVYYRGVKVGGVGGASVREDAVVLSLNIEGIKNIPADSKFIIKDLSFIGGKVIEIIPGVSSDFLKNEDTVRAFPEKGISDVVNDFKEIKPKIDGILNNVDKLTGGEIYKELYAAVRDLHSTINTTRRFIDGDLTNTLTSYNKIAMNNEAKISALISSLNKNSAELSAFLNGSSKAALSFDSLLTKINDGRGSLGAMVQSDSLYNNLNSAIKSIDSLASDIKSNPSKYINVSVF